MKKQIVLVLIGLLMVPASLFAQKNIEITGYTGWMLGGRVNLYNGSLKVHDGQNWGIILNKYIAYGTQLEVMYNRLVSEVELREYANDPEILFKMSTQYFHIGGLYELMNETKIRPFGVGSLGATVFHAQDASYSDRWRFSIGLGAGLKFFPTERIGIRLQARMLVPMYLNGLWFGVGTGGASAGVSSSSTIVQGDFTGGIILAF
jgi:opacity protein-like surface antigen